uniref:Uncharacterized protein n=1 Tax=Glossina pallidipes TaxID=7398 RepID=A0A1A9ZF78_GLOPL
MNSYGNCDFLQRLYSWNNCCNERTSSLCLNSKQNLCYKCEINHKNFRSSLLENYPKYDCNIHSIKNLSKNKNCSSICNNQRLYQFSLLTDVEEFLNLQFDVYNDNWPLEHPFFEYRQNQNGCAAQAGNKL